MFLNSEECFELLKLQLGFTNKIKFWSKRITNFKLFLWPVWIVQYKMLVWKNECLYLSLMHERRIGIFRGILFRIFVFERTAAKDNTSNFIQSYWLFRNQKWANSPQTYYQEGVYHHRRYRVIDGRRLLQRVVSTISHQC